MTYASRDMKTSSLVRVHDCLCLRDDQGHDINLCFKSQAKQDILKMDWFALTEIRCARVTTSGIHMWMGLKDKSNLLAPENMENASCTVAVSHQAVVQILFS
jgi:hypothetical protein